MHKKRYCVLIIILSIFLLSGLTLQVRKSYSEEPVEDSSIYEEEVTAGILSSAESLFEGLNLVPEETEIIEMDISDLIVYDGSSITLKEKNMFIVFNYDLEEDQGPVSSSAIEFNAYILDANGTRFDVPLLPGPSFSSLVSIMIDMGATYIPLEGTIYIKGKLGDQEIDDSPKYKIEYPVSQSDKDEDEQLVGPARFCYCEKLEIRNKGKVDNPKGGLYNVFAVFVKLVDGSDPSLCTEGQWYAASASEDEDALTAALEPSDDTDPSDADPRVHHADGHGGLRVS